MIHGNVLQEFAASDQKTTKVGSAVVLGGGVGGMQAALDLAEAGIKVYLVDKESAIGGVMSQLDKTFPTNDCSMCIVSPRLVDVGRHLNIETICNADLQKVEGRAGDFNVTLKQKTRYIDLEKCTGCGLCSEKCPITKKSEFDMGMAQRKAIFRRYPQAVPSGFTIDKEGISPCRFGCPLGVNAHGYVALIADGRFEEALEVEKRRNPFPSICGRICPAPCEAECRRGDLDQPVAIRQLKRFLGDWERKNGRKPLEPTEDKKSEKVAVIGAGPAGLTLARELKLKGYNVTIFEANPKAGGMLISGIPPYRLPRDVNEWEIQEIFDLGVELKANTRIGKDISFDQIKNDYDAVFVATGTPRGRSMKLEGEDTISGLYDCIQFLREVNLEDCKSIGKKVIVVGVDNAAIDAARTAQRLDTENVTIVYPRSRREMPANPTEVHATIEEGIEIKFLTNPVRLIADENNKLTGVECIRMELGEPDESGRRRPVPIEGSEFIIEADVLIPAISQEPDLTFFGDKLQPKTTRVKTLVVDPVTLETTVPGVFAGGDVVSGPATVIEGISAGLRAAESIDRYLKKEDMHAGREEAKWIRAERDIDGEPIIPRHKIPEISVEERTGNFNEVELGWDEETAIAEAKRCLDCAACCECLMCLAACEAMAIDHNMEREEIITLEAGAIIVAPGYELFNADNTKELGYDRFPNVLASLEFERLLSASGPTMGEIQRPSDGEHPKNIAFIQCVGSRTVENNYCSSVCCMYATKEAVIAKEHQPDLECSIFYIDLRAYGKGFDEYYERAKEHGVRYVRCRPSAILQDQQTKDVIIQYVDDQGKQQVGRFSMAVLSCGLSPPEGVHEFAQRLGIELNDLGFCKTSRIAPVDTTREGIYTCGPFNEPKDIPETVMQASAAAARAMSLLSEVKWTRTAKKEYPPERNVNGEDPHIGVFVCHCGKNIGGVIDCKAVAEYAKGLNGVVYATDKLYTCSQDSIASITETVKEQNLNRVIVAACTPRTHEPLFRDSIREAGLNPYLFEFANIRDQNTWVHQSEPQKAFEKAKDLVRMSVGKARLLEPLYDGELKINKNALVIGGGMSGMTAALELASQRFPVHLVEREKELGGIMRRLHYLIDGDDPQKKLKETIEKVQGHDKIKVYLDCQIESLSGSLGNFETTLKPRNGSEGETIKHGVVVVATGAQELKPDEYLYGQDERVLTQLELEEKLASGDFSAKNVVMIQCVGSRNEERPYCSRVCCTHAIKNALQIKEKSPDTNVYILYRDVRTYGFHESWYRHARDKGVIFLRYDQDKKPEVTKDGDGFEIAVHDPILHTDLRLTADSLVLSAAIIANDDAEDIAQLLKVPVNSDKFFLEAHMKLRPVDFATDGVFLAGLAHSPKAVDESIIQALGAAGRASTYLSKDSVTLPAAISEVIDENCDGCAYCVDPCPYNAITLIEFMHKGDIKKTVESDPSACKGCGVCQATCPKQGIRVNHFRLDQLGAMVEALLLEG